MTVALTLDTSGSVGAAQLTRARDLALAVLAALPDGSEVAVLAFDDQSRVVVPRTSQADEVRRQLASLKVGGRFTALHDALYDASRYVREAPGARKAIVLITDGIDENSALSLEDGLRVATDAQIPVFAVGVGPHPEERVLRRIAKLTGGQYVAFDHARGTELAALIASAPTAISASAALPETGGAARTSAGRASTASPRVPAPLTSPPPSGPARALWLAAILTAMTVGAVLLLVRRRRSVPACATCARPLPSGSLTCPSCAVVPARIPPRPPPARILEPDLSPTVLSRMNTTEEYLERTITLQERPVLAITRGPGVGQVFNLSETTATSIGRSRA
ncbi:MAG TPA: vWA domain-containing protein, partial [Vicinamibacteria bacterium]|nr:vWA domain-containing protein [Vicinamibacteria bacterium]